MDGEAKTSARGGLRMPRPSTIILGASGLAILAVVALPLFKQREQPMTAAADARTAYLTLMEQMGQATQQGEGLGAVSAVDSSAAALSPTGRLERDLFAPWSHRSVAATASESLGQRATPATPSRRRAPALNGILIDGQRARAVIGDQVVSVGDRVGDYRVVEIQANWVLLKRGDQIEKLELGGGR